MTLSARRRRAQDEAEWAPPSAVVVRVDDSASHPGRSAYGVASIGEPLTYWTSAPGEAYRIVTDDNGTPIGAERE